MEQRPRIYTVGTAHLDTIWNWDFETTIREYLPKTLKQNFMLFKKHPQYTFSFEGSYRYELMEEYYPEEFETLKDYVAQGRWHVAGSSYENGDVNIPSPEALFRNILYGNDYFEKTFGKRSVDIYLPDCFGFGLALPSIARHANLKGFTTQKLTWSSAYGIPFDLGKWVGVDGSYIYASLDAQDYSASLSAVREHKNAKAKLARNRRLYDLPMTYLLHGVGDIGGAPKEPSVKTVCNEMKQNGSQEVEVLSASTDQIFRDMDSQLTKEQKEKLPQWHQELVSTDHGVGGYTSRAIGKRWNKRNEQLADAAERTLVAAHWMGVQEYPRSVLDTAWKRVIAHQFHDDMPGTSLQHCYKRSWNDYMLSLNQFAEEYRGGVNSAAGLLDTSFVRGIKVVVSNPVQGQRQGAVEAQVELPAGTSAVRVLDSEGTECPAQITGWKAGKAAIVFVARVPSVGLAVYDVQPAKTPSPAASDLLVTPKTLENRKYRVTLDDRGDIASVIDKTMNQELLQAPIRMGLHRYNGSHNWPAWELDYAEVMAEPLCYADHPKFRIVESGPARIAVETERKADGSRFKQTIYLEQGGDSVRVENEIEWNSSRRLLKTPFSFTVGNKEASYDLGLGVIRRGINSEKLYEVPAQSWADLSDGRYGVSVLSDSKYGWDMPNENTLRLTGIHTPRADFRKKSAQSFMDLGLNRYGFGLFSHAGEAGKETQLAAARFNQPMATFVVEQTQGILPGTWSFASLNNDSVLLRAVKMAQNSEEIIVRVNEGEGKTQKKVKLCMGNGIQSAREVYASEEPFGEAVVKNGELIFDLTPYEPKTFALKLSPFKQKIQPMEQTPVALPYHVGISSSNTGRANGPLKGQTLPAEQIPDEIYSGGIRFHMAGDGGNALLCQGQSVAIPKGYDRIELLLTSAHGDKKVAFQLGDSRQMVSVPDCQEAIGAWDLYGMGETGYVKDCVLAWYATHMHDAGKDVIARQTYFFKVSLVIPEGAAELLLPREEDVLILAATVVKDSVQARTATELYDRLDPRPFTYRRAGRENRLSKWDGVLHNLEQVKPLSSIFSRL